MSLSLETQKKVGLNNFILFFFKCETLECGDLCVLPQPMERGAWTAIAAGFVLPRRGYWSFLDLEFLLTGSQSPPAVERSSA